MFTTKSNQTFIPTTSYEKGISQSSYTTNYFTIQSWTNNDGNWKNMSVTLVSGIYNAEGGRSRTMAIKYGGTKLTGTAHSDRNISYTEYFSVPALNQGEVFELGVDYSDKYYGNVKGTITVTGTLEVENTFGLSAVIIGYPKELKGIGTNGAIYVFGVRNGEFYSGFKEIITAIGTGTSATAGSIAIGNAVGYLSINFNGEVLKIPYYT